MSLSFSGLCLLLPSFKKILYTWISLCIKTTALSPFSVILWLPELRYSWCDIPVSAYSCCNSFILQYISTQDSALSLQNRGQTIITFWAKMLSIFYNSVRYSQFSLDLEDPWWCGSHPLSVFFTERSHFHASLWQAEFLPPPQTHFLTPASVPVYTSNTVCLKHCFPRHFYDPPYLYNFNVYYHIIFSEKIY